MCKSTKNKNTPSPGPGTAAGASPGPPVPPVIRDSVTSTFAFTNPLKEPTIATILPQPNNKNQSGPPQPIASVERFNETREYKIFVPEKLATDFFNSPPGSKPKARVSLFFGVGVEMSLFRLRVFFADTTNSVFITIPGVEDGPGWPGVITRFGIGITTDMIKKLFVEAGMPAIDFSVEVIAAYSTGYRGVNLTIINELVDLTKLSRVIYLDAWFHHDDHPLAPPASPFHRKNTQWAINTAIGKSPAVKIVIYGFTHPGGVPRTLPDPANTNVENPPREPIAPLIAKFPTNIIFIDFEFKFQTVKAIADEVEKICLARLIQLGIADGKFLASTIVAPLEALVNALPERGSLGKLGRAGFTDLHTWIAAHSSEVSAFNIAEAMKKVVAFKLLKGWTTSSHLEMRHRMFVLELGKEPLLP